MTKIEKTELALIPLIGFVFFARSSVLPTQLSVGNLLLMLSALLLLQSLIRDICILVATRRDNQTHDTKAMRCMCVESAFGMTGILAGAGILGFGFDPQVAMGQWSWALAAILTFSIGYAIKDFILMTNPWRIVRDKNHLNIAVSWRK